MRYHGFKWKGQRMLALLLAAVLLVQAAPVIPANAAQVSDVPTAQEITADPAPKAVTEEVPEVTEEVILETEEAPKVTEATIPVTPPESVPATTEETVPETTTEAVPEVTEEIVPETTTEAVPEVTEETVPETTTEAVPEVTEETVPETTTETVPEVTEETPPETTEETVAVESGLQSITIVDAPKTVEVVSITTLSAILEPEDSQEPITWSVKPAELASIDEDGVLMVLDQTGNLEITATAGGLSHTVQVEIVEPTVLEETPAEGKELPGYIFGETWDSAYDVLYYLSDESYVYDGKAVSFPDGNTVLVGEISYPIKNAVTTVSAVTEGGKTTVTFSGLKTPIGSISQEWNSNFDGKFAIHGKVNGQAVTPTVTDRISNVKLVMDTPNGGSFTFTDGTIYEESNPYGSGHDFGNGAVYAREFGYLPEFTVMVDAPTEPPVEPEQPEPPASNAPFTAKMGDRALTILDGKTEYCDKSYGNVPVYTVVIPEEETADSFTLSGEGLFYIKGGGCADRTWKIEGSVELKILDGKSYHLMKDWEAFHIAFQKGNAEPEVPPVEPGKPTENAPFTAKIGEKTLVIEEGPNVHCDKGGNVPYYIVVLPKGETAQSVTVTGELESYSKGEGGELHNCAGSAELPILKGESYHVVQGFKPFPPPPRVEYYHIAFRYDDGALKIPEISANIGTRVLEVAEVSGSGYGCGVTRTYAVKVPDTLKNQPVIIDGLKDYTYRAVNAGDACEGAQEAFGGTVTVNEFGYHFTADEKYDPDYRQLHIIFQEFHEEGPKAPFSVMLAGKELQVDVLPPASEYAPVGLLIHVPTPFAKTVTFSGVKDWMYLKKNQTMGQTFTIETNDWEAEILGPDEFQIVQNWPASYRVTYAVADAAEANIVLNAQMDGKFLLPPETVAGVAPGLAKSLGYAYGDGITEMDITALDALVKMHQLKYPGEDVTKYLVLDEKGMITKVFGVETGAVGFAVNGTAPATPIHATRIDEGSTLDFYNFQDTDQWSDKTVWLEQNGQKKSQFAAAVGKPLTLTVKSADDQGNVTAVAGVQLATVADDGTITPMQGITDENGHISVSFPEQGTYTVTVISSEDIKVIMPIVHVTVSDNTAVLSVEARAAGQGDFLAATVMLLNPDEPQTVKDLLDAAAREFALDVSYTQGGGLQSINGLSGTEGGWRYFVNGKAAQDSVEEHKVVKGDEIRIRFAVSASAEELDAPLYAYLQKLVAEANNKLKLSYTQETKQVLQAAVTAAEEVLKDPANNSSATDRELLVSKHIAAVNAGLAQLVAEETALDPAIPKDFENDLWLQYDHKNLKVGETASIYPRRIPQIIDDPINNHVTRPVFTFTLVEGDSVTLSHTESREKTSVTAVKEGVSVVKVSYRAEGNFGPCSPINEGLVVFNVTSGECALNIETSLSKIRSYDTIYYTGSDTVSYPFTVSIQDAQKVEVLCNGEPLEETDGRYTAQLENRSNVIEIIATDAQGATATYYQVVDARKIQVVVDNLTSPGQPFKINDRARVSFRGITMPVSKLATIYNPVFKTWDENGNEVMPSHVVYENQQLGIQKGYCRQDNLATQNAFEVTFAEAGDYHFTNGHIHCAWWGDELGSDKEKEGSGDQNMGALIRQDDFCQMPDFTIHVSDEISDHVPVKGVKLNKEALTLKEGESFQLTAQVLPEDATNRNVTWSCDDPTGFFIDLTKDGKITAKNAATKEKPAVTVTVTTAEGTMTASCKVVVQAVPHGITVENGTASVESAPRKTVVTIKADQAPKGKIFDHWEVVSGTVNLKNSKKAETTFVMPDMDVSLKAVYANQKPGGSTHRYPYKGNQPASNTVNAKVEKGMVSAKTLAEIKGKDQNLRIKGKLENGKEFIWTINGKDVDVVKELKVGMSQKGKFQKDIEMLAENPEIFRFQQDGKLPYPMMVEMPSELADGGYLLMHYNTAERRAEKVAKVTIKDGMFRFLAKEGGEYFLAKRVSGKTVPELEAVTLPTAETVPETTEAVTEEAVENTNQTVNRESRFVWILLALVAAGCGYLLGTMTKKRKEK